MANEYTFQFQRSFDGKTWTPVNDAETVEDVTDPQWSVDYIADDLASGYGLDDLPAGTTWRLCGWSGADADTRAEPDVVSGPARGSDDGVLLVDMSPEDLLNELTRTRDQIAVLSDRRDAIIRILMPRDSKVKVHRPTIAKAAGVKEARLYQIRDQ
jgi:hypothetical protein